MGSRPVTVAPSGSPAPSIRDSREAGRVAGALETQPGSRSRRATAGTSSSAVGFHGAGAGPHRPARTRDAPGREPGSAPDTGVPENLAKRVKPDPVPGFTALPWLTERQNEDRGELYRRLAEWGGTAHDSSQPRAEAYEALGRVSRMERDLMRADELLQGMRTRLLSEAEWGELRFLVEQARANTPHRMGRAMNMLDGLAQSRGLSTAEAGLLKASLRRLDTAHEFLTSAELPWQGIVKRVEVPLREGLASTALVESRVVPGTAFGSCFEHGYSWEPDAPLVEKILSGNVPHLAQTRLTGATGETLFCGLHQGFMGLPELEIRQLRALPHVDLRRLVSEFVLHRITTESSAAFQARVERYCFFVGQSPAYTRRAVRPVQLRALERMAGESAAAALCSNPENLHRALCDKKAGIRLFNVALLTQDERFQWGHQYCEYCHWEVGHGVRLNLRGPGREPCPVWATVSVRHFALCVDDQGLDLPFRVGRGENVVKLLGGMDSRELGGDVLARVKALRSRVRKLGGELAVAAHERVRTLPPGALAHSGGVQASNRVTALQAEMARLDRHARALEQAAQQLKDMWWIPSEWPTGADAYGAAARLALVAYLMGETPVLSCAGGRDYNKRLDAEVKVLATVTDCRGGQVPPADLDTDIWDTARTAFREQ